MSLSSHKKLHQLPLAFQKANGNINSELLKQIFNPTIIQKPQGKIRDLLRTIRGVRLHTNDDPFCQFSVELQAVDFRAQWYRAVDAKKRGILPPFFFVIDRWVHHEHNNLGFDSKALEQFFDKRRMKQYPRLENISILSEQLIYTAEQSLISSTLFAWSLLESTSWHSVLNPNEKSLSHFRGVLLTDLRERGATDLLALLEDGIIYSGDTDNSVPVIEPSTFKHEATKSADLVATKAITERFEPNSVIKINSICVGKVRELDALVDQVIVTHCKVTEAVTSVLSTECAVSRIDDVIESMKKLRGCILNTEASASGVESGIASLVTEAMQRLGVSIAPITLPKFSFATFEQWKEFVGTSHELVKLVLLRAESLSKFDTEMIHAIVSTTRDSSIELQDVEKYLTTIENQAESLTRGLVAINALQSILDARKTDFSWNPILDSSISSEYWINAGEYLAAQGSMPRVLGVCARSYYKQLHSSIAQFVDRNSIRDEIPLEDTFEVLSCMTLGQLEGINCATENGKLLLAIAEFRSFLLIANESYVDAHVLWSARPLTDYVNEQRSSVAERFFKAAHEASSQDGEHRLNLSELRRLVMLPDATSILKLQDIEDTLRHNLLMIVEYHGGGGHTHAQLWRSAHKVICRPIQELAEQMKLVDIADYYRQFRHDFHIDNYLYDWKLSIREDLRKQSQYDKNLRQAVNGKLVELDEWLNYYESIRDTTSSEKSTDPISKLKSSISNVLSSFDSEGIVLRRWLQSLAKRPISRPVVYSSLSRAVDPSFTEVLIQTKSDAFHPRVFIAETRGIKATAGDLLADEIFLDFGFYTTKRLASAYADQQYYEAFSVLSAVSSEEIPVDIERKMEAAVEDLDAKFALRINEIEAKSTNLDQETAKFIAENVADIRCFITNQQWTRTAYALSDLEPALNGFLRDEENARLEWELRQKIIALGCDVPIDENIETLQDAHSRAVTATRNRRQHLAYLDKVLTVQGLDSVIKDEYAETLTTLERPEMLPCENRSGEVAYVFSETLAILLDELRRSKKLLPAYAQKLKALALAVANSLRLHGVVEDSTTILLLEESAANWSGIPDGNDELIDRLLSIFSVADLSVTLPSALEISPDIPAPPETSDSLHAKESIYMAYVDRLIAAVSIFGSGIDQENRNSLFTPTNAMGENKLSVRALSARSSYKKCDEPQSSAAFGYLTEWAIAMLKEHEAMLPLEEQAAALYLINKFQKSSAVRALLPTKSSKAQLGEISTQFLACVARSCGLTAASNPVDLILDLSNNIDCLKVRRSLFLVAFTPIGNDDSLTVKHLWESYSGDPRQAEARAALMNIFWQTSVPSALACCLKYSPVDIEPRTADALAHIADQALSKGRVDLLQSFVDLRRTVSAKPFQLFVGLLLSKIPTKADPPAQISLVGPLEKSAESNGLIGILSIKPRRSDSPNSITLRLPKTSPLSFETGALSKVLKGPFIDEEIFLSVSFLLGDQNAHNFIVLVDCEAISITGIISEFSVRLGFEINGDGSHTKIPVEEIEDAFQQFPHGQMRGADYIHRPDDERRIEKDLFKSKTIRSLWISSPRRSGKTTMLYRILDGYSHKTGSGNLIAYFSLNKSFDSTEKFNDWLWKTLKNSPDNAELRALFDDFSVLGRDLPHEADVGTFIETIADRLVNSARGKPSRTIFLFDEIDKLATMFFEGGSRKDAANEIAWQLRQLIGRRRDIGFVFAGSSAAKKIFLTNQDAPFFNAGILFELSPFSCDTPENEKYARAIIEPPRIKGRLTIPRASLERMLWVCSGIPYYMKLLAGATYAVAKQSHVLLADVNEALHALLEKRTGISILDQVEGDPGSDELRTIALEKGADRFLTQGVLYSVAELESPLSGHPIRRAHLYGESSPLITRYQLPRVAIERGLDRAIELGLLKLSADSPPKISYAIPILGESIRNSCGSYWGEIDHQLEQLSRELRTTSK